MKVRIGPVSGAAARAWCEHLRANLDVVAARREVLPFNLPDEVVEAFAVLLDEWRQAASGDIFEWSADFTEDELRSLVRYWANLNAMTARHLDEFGITWSPDDARPFFHALVAGVEQAFVDEGRPDPFLVLLNGAQPE